MIMILFKSLRKRTSTGSYYDEKSLTKCYCPRPYWFCKIKNPCIHMGFCLVRKKRLELSQDKLPLEPESSASAIPPLPLDM